MMAKPGTSKQADDRELCGICHENNERYTCPRCNISICSLQCYKSQSHEQCSELFYKKCVEDELSYGNAGAMSKKKMENILQRLSKNLDEDDDGEPLDSDDSVDNDDDLASRIAGIDLDDSEALWSVLTDQEKKEYSDLLASSGVTKIFPDWNPWWIDGNDTPILAPDIPMIATLIKTKPSPILPYLVMNTLMAYQISLRIIQGQSQVLCVEAATIICSLSPSLCTASSECSSVEKAADLIVTEFNKQSWGLEFPVTFENITQDLKDLTVVSSCNILLALSHVKNILTDAIEIISATKNTPRFTGNPPKVSDLKKIVKKIIFYLSWTKQMDDSNWDRLVGNAELIIMDD